MQSTLNWTLRESCVYGMLTAIRITSHGYERLEWTKRISFVLVVHGNWKVERKHPIFMQINLGVWKLENVEDCWAKKRLLIWTRWLATPRLKNSFLMFVLLRFLNGFGLCPRWLHMLWYVVKNSLLPNMSSVFLPVILYVCMRSPRNLLIFVVVGLRHRRKCLALHCVSKNRRNDYSDIKPEAEVTSRVLVRVRSRLDCADDRDLG